MPGNQDPLAQGGEHLHGGNTAAWRDAGGSLYRQGGDAGQFVDAVHAVVVEEHGVVAVDVPAPEEVHLPPLVDDLPVREIGALRPVGRGQAWFAVEGQSQVSVAGKV